MEWWPGTCANGLHPDIRPVLQKLKTNVSKVTNAHNGKIILNSTIWWKNVWDDWEKTAQVCIDE